MDPPTKRTSSIFSLVSPESLIQFSHGLMVFFKKSSQIDSNLALEIVKFKCLGPVESAVKYGRLTSVDWALESSILAFSAPSLIL